MIKIWGDSTLAYSSSTFSKYNIQIRQNHYCSKHYHKFKNNIFHILKGKLAVFIYEGRNSHYVILEPDDFYSIPPMVIHSFFAITDVLAVEMYNSALGQSVQEEDIVRFDEGGSSDSIEAFARQSRILQR